MFVTCNVFHDDSTLAMFLANFRELKNEKEERKKGRNETVDPHANRRKRASWGKRRVFMELAYSGGSSYVLPIWSATRRASTSCRFTRGAFIQDAKIFASSREEAFHVRLAVAPFSSRFLPFNHKTASGFYHWILFLFSPTFSFPSQLNRDELNSN